MKTILRVCLMGVVCLLCGVESIAQPYYWILDGTMSHRLNASGTQTDPDHLYRRDYYGAPSGSMSSFNSGNYTSSGRTTGFQDFTLIWHLNDPNFVTNNDNLNVIPTAYISTILLNFRMAFPHEYEDNPESTEKYPLIVMMHGVGEIAVCRGSSCYEPDQPEYFNNDNNVYHGGEAHLQAINRAENDLRHWPGFALFPQSGSGWNYGVNMSSPERVAILIEQLIKKYPIDPNRVYVHGLSDGAKGSYLLMYERPDLIAAAAPMSGSVRFGYKTHNGYTGASPNDYDPAETLVHIPIWQFQGENDNSPSPITTKTNIGRITDEGGSVRYTEYPNTGHATWYAAYAEPDFFSWFLQYSKLTIHSFYNVTEICEGDNQKLGITGGFAGYEWQKSLDTQNPDWQPLASIPGRPHEVLVNEAGLYRVRFMRAAGDPNAGWTEWSEPFDLKVRQRPKPEIATNGSWALFGLDNNSSLTLSSTAENAISYKWFKNGSAYSSGPNVPSITLNQSGQGDYTLQYTDDRQCTSLISEPIYVNRAPFATPLPTAPSNLAGEATSISSSSIWWTDNSDNELGYEVYRSLNGTNYTWLTNTAPDAIAFEDSGLPSGVPIYYRIRAFNENGPSGEANVLQINMPEDTNPPSVPQNFAFERFNIHENRINPENKTIEGVVLTFYDEFFDVLLDQAILSWDPVEDETDIYYDIYSNSGTLVGTTQDTTYIVTGLAENTNYLFYVKARDINNLTSPASEKAQVFTAFTGLYKYSYAGAIWDVIKDYSIHPQTSITHTNNFTVETNSAVDYIAADFAGYIYITDASGPYTFYTKSDDGSSVWIDGELVVDNDGLHGNGTEVPGTHTFTSTGAHSITVKWFERTGGNNLQVSWQGPGTGGKHTIPSNVLKSSNDTPPLAPSAPSGLIASESPTLNFINLNWNYSTTAKDVVVLGSSTATGEGASPGMSWVEQFTAALQGQNASSTVQNLAVGAYTSYKLLPGTTGDNVFNSQNPDPAHNITAALALNPDIILVNLPSNDAALGYSISTTIANLQSIKAAADAAGVDIYFTTTQPRNFTVLATRQRLQTEAQSIRDAFGSYVIDTYAKLTSQPDLNIKPIYDSGDGTHLNDAAHTYIASEVINSVGGQSIPSFDIYRSLSSGGTYQLIDNTIRLSYPNIGLLGGTTYYYKIKAVTSNGVSGYSNTANATTIGDITPPTAPTNLTANANNYTQVLLSWTASTDNIGVAKYQIIETSGQTAGKIGSAYKIAASVFGETTHTSILLNNLQPSQSYTFTIRALDAAGNISPNADPAVTLTTGTPLPVEFLFVTHQLVEKGVYIKWATASELNNAYFTVERGTGLDNFEELGGVDGSGTSHERHDYSFTDTNPLELAYYRIKQTDFDGKYKYSKIIRVVYDENDLPQFSVYPNPTTNENINASGYVPSTQSSVIVKLVDVMGRVHMEENLDPNQFLDGVKINLNHPVPPGVYIIVISDGTKNTQRRVVIR